jgi:hypothetical protein
VTGDPLQYEPSAEPIDTAPRGYLFLSKENEALLRDTLTRTGVELGEYDDLILALARYVGIRDGGGCRLVDSPGRPVRIGEIGQPPRPRRPCQISG